MTLSRLFTSAACSVSLACAVAAQEPAPVEVVGAPPPPVTTSVPAVPQQAPTANEPSFGPLPAFVAPKGSKVDNRGLMWRMNHYTAGERVMAIGYGQFRDDIKWSDDAFKAERTLVGRLQMIAEKQSSQTLSYIPFKVGSAFVVAPDSRDQANLDLSGASEFDLSGRGLLIDQILLAIPENQIAALGSDNGIAVSSLSRDLQSALARAFRTPLKVMNRKPGSYKSDDGLQHASTDMEDKGKLEDPIDWSSARLRAQLHLTGAMVDMKPYGSFISIPDTGLVFATEQDQQRNYRDRGVDLPLFDTVPNTYKPSDLTGKTFVQPLNYAGLWTVSEVVKQISKLTGLKMYVSAVYADEPVFIGSNALTVGEAIDGLRLGLTAAWRKLGGAYVLAWDRLGVQAVQMLAHESAEAASKAVKRRRRDTDASTDWVKLADNLGFDTSSGIALDADQRKKLFGARTSKSPSSPFLDQRRIPYTEMTPDQQAWIREAAKNDSVSLPAVDGQPEVKRPFTDDDIKQSYLQGDLRVDVSVKIPDYGWISAASDWGQTSVSSWSIASKREKLEKGPEAVKRSVLDDAPKELRDLIENPKPAVPPAPIRALMVPPLGAARLKVLADEMKRHGLNVLFYPVLFGGYATFDSKVFPPHPSLRGIDGWAAATAAMAPAGIKVVGYLHTLAWQNAGDKTHYLSKHPEWMDLDVVGRPRINWFDAHPDAQLKAASLGVLAANYVRPQEPMVSYRLQTLVDEFSKKANAAGICFAEWEPAGPEQNGPFSAVSTPALGYAFPDRLERLQKTGQDPVDTLVSWDDYVPPSLADRRWSIMQNTETKMADPHKTLVIDLLKRAKADRKDWKTWLVNSASFDFRPDQSDQDPKKEADEVVGGVFGAMMPGAGKAGVLLPVTSRNLLASMAEDDFPVDEVIPDSVLKMPAIVTYSLFFSQMMSPENPQKLSLASAIYDFRTSPEEISTSLQWIKAPDKDTPTTAKPAVKAPPATTTLKKTVR